MCVTLIVGLVQFLCVTYNASRKVNYCCFMEQGCPNVLWQRSIKSYFGLVRGPHVGNNSKLYTCFLIVIVRVFMQQIPYHGNS
jgi:hypothetical protein